MPSVHIHHHTRAEFRSRIDSNEIRAAIIPVGAIEQHLEHLNMEHDWRSVLMIAEKVAEEMSPNVVVASALMAGISEHHMNHPGTLSLRPATFLAVLTDLIDSIVRTGIKNILVLNGHGGNTEPCRAVWDQLLRQFQVNLQFLPYWEVLNEADSALLKTKTIPGHAQEFETAVACAWFPENIRQRSMQQQVDQSPLSANAENGNILLTRIVERVSQRVQSMTSGTNVAKTPAYFP